MFDEYMMHAGVGCGVREKPNKGEPSEAYPLTSTFEESVPKISKASQLPFQRKTSSKAKGEGSLIQDQTSLDPAARRPAPIF